MLTTNTPIASFRIPQSPETAEADLEILQEQAFRSARSRVCRPQWPDAQPPLPQEISERLAYELELIGRNDSAPAFLAAAHFAHRTPETHRPLRSGAGYIHSSLVAYCLGITEFNPLRHGLIFEVLIDPEDPRPVDLGFSVASLGEGTDRLRGVLGHASIRPPADEPANAISLMESPVLMVLRRLLDRVEHATGTRPRLEEFPEENPAAWALLNRGPRGVICPIELRQAGLMSEAEMVAHGMRSNTMEGIGGWSCKNDPVASIEELAVSSALSWHDGTAWALGDLARELRACKDGKPKVLAPHASLKPVLADTCGLMIFREQFVLAASVLTGWSLGTSIRFFKAMARARIDEVWKWSERFVEASIEKQGLPRSEAQKLAAWMSDRSQVVQLKSYHLGEALDIYRLAHAIAQYPEALEVKARP